MTENSNITCEVHNRNTVYTSTADGLKPLIHWLENQPEIINGGYVIDKIVGKASALLLIYGKAQKVFGKVMSRQADEILTRYGIEHSYETYTERIINRKNTDICPMEKVVADIDDPQLAYEKLSEAVKKMK